MLPDAVDYRFFRLFRIIFGICLADAALEELVAGYHKYALQELSFHFHYWGLQWVKPLPSPYFTGCYIALICSSLLFAAGLFWRVTSILNLVLYGYLHLLEKADYNNHYYLVGILCLYFCLSEIPNSRPDGKRWFLDLFRYQFALVYFFAGVAKWNRDWLLGEPLTIWLQRLAAYYQAPWLAGLYFSAFLAVAGLLVDLLAGPALFHPRTRVAAIFVLILFHSSNELFFEIGTFPALMLGSLLLFLGPTSRPSKVWLTSAPPLLVAFLCVQMLLPMRHYLIPGMCSWTEDGHRYSWRMKLRSKRPRLEQIVVNGQTFEPRGVLSRTQIRMMASRPDLIIQFTEYLQREHQARSVRMLITASLNGRPRQTFVHPRIELTEAEVSPWRTTMWIEELKTPYIPKDSKYTRRAAAGMLYALTFFQFMLGVIQRRRDSWTFGSLLLCLGSLRLLFVNEGLTVTAMGAVLLGIWGGSKKNLDSRILLVMTSVLWGVLASIVSLY